MGQWAELRQRDHWLPFLITHVHDADTVSGVGFSGRPHDAGWNRPYADFSRVQRGDGNRQWRPKPRGRQKPVASGDVLTGAVRVDHPSGDLETEAVN